MKQNKYLLNTLLAALVGTALLICVLVRTFAPSVIIPDLDIPNMVALSLLALIADHYLTAPGKRNYPVAALLAAVTFGLLPWAASFAAPLEALKLGIVGGVTFTVTAALYASIQDRLSTGPVSKAAPILSAFGLFLAAQCFAGFL